MKQSATFIFHQTRMNPIKRRRKKKKSISLLHYLPPTEKTSPQDSSLPAPFPAPSPSSAAPEPLWLLSSCLPPQIREIWEGKAQEWVGAHPEGNTRPPFPQCQHHHKMATSPHEAWPWRHSPSLSGWPPPATNEALISLHSGKEEEDEEDFGWRCCHEDQEGLPSHHGARLGQPLAG